MIRYLIGSLAIFCITFSFCALSVVIHCEDGKVNDVTEHILVNDAGSLEGGESFYIKEGCYPLYIETSIYRGRYGYDVYDIYQYDKSKSGYYRIDMPIYTNFCIESLSGCEKYISLHHDIIDSIGGDEVSNFIDLIYKSYLSGGSGFVDLFFGDIGFFKKLFNSKYRAVRAALSEVGFNEIYSIHVGFEDIYDNSGLLVGKLMSLGILLEGEMVFLNFNFTGGKFDLISVSSGIL